MIDMKRLELTQYNFTKKTTGRSDPVYINLRLMLEKQYSFFKLSQNNGLQTSVSFNTSFMLLYAVRVIIDEQNPAEKPQEELSKYAEKVVAAVQSPDTPNMLMI